MLNAGWRCDDQFMTARAEAGCFVANRQDHKGDPRMAVFVSVSEYERKRRRANLCCMWFLYVVQTNKLTVDVEQLLLAEEPGFMAAESSPRGLYR